MRGTKKTITIGSERVEDLHVDGWDVNKALKVISELQDLYVVKLKWSWETIKVTYICYETDIKITVQGSTKSKGVDCAALLTACVYELHNQIELTEEYFRSETGVKENDRA